MIQSLQLFTIWLRVHRVVFSSAECLFSVVVYNSATFFKHLHHSEALNGRFTVSSELAKSAFFQALKVEKIQHPSVSLLS